MQPNNFPPLQDAVLDKIINHPMEQHTCQQVMHLLDALVESASEPLQVHTELVAFSLSVHATCDLPGSVRGLPHRV